MRFCQFLCAHPSLFFMHICVCMDLTDFFLVARRYLLSNSTPTCRPNSTLVGWSKELTLFSYGRRRRRKKKKEGMKEEPTPSFYQKECPCKSELCWLSCGCLEGVWKLSGGCLEGVWKLSGGSLKVVWWVSGGCQEGVRRVSIGCLNVI